MASIIKRTVYLMRIILFLSIWFACAGITLAQANVNRQEQALLKTMDEGVELMMAGAYHEADQKFMRVLENIRVVPSNLTYYFGRNSFHLGKNKQAIDWLNKYIELRGTSGQYFEEASKYLLMAEKAFREEREQQAADAGQVLSTRYEIDCGPAGKVKCPICKGKTVIVTKGFFGDEFKACEYCDKHGFLTCTEYNLLLKGELKPKN
jgi:tetratricopeptide (TPR) repeat protein